MRAAASRKGARQHTEDFTKESGTREDLSVLWNANIGLSAGGGGGAVRKPLVDRLNY
jgi:hypothetical protein